MPPSPVDEIHEVLNARNIVEMPDEWQDTFAKHRSIGEDFIRSTQTGATSLNAFFQRVIDLYNDMTGLCKQAAELDGDRCAAAHWWLSSGRQDAVTDMIQDYIKPTTAPAAKLELFWKLLALLKEFIDWTTANVVWHRFSGKIVQGRVGRVA